MQSTTSLDAQPLIGRGLGGHDLIRVNDDSTFDIAYGGDGNDIIYGNGDRLFGGHGTETLIAMGGIPTSWSATAAIKSYKAKMATTTSSAARARTTMLHGVVQLTLFAPDVVLTILS